MNGPTTLKTCNGCELLNYGYTKYSSDYYRCVHPDIYIGGGLDAFTTQHGVLMIICPRICPMYNNK